MSSLEQGGVSYINLGHSKTMQRKTVSVLQKASRKAHQVVCRKSLSSLHSGVNASSERDYGLDHRNFGQAGNRCSSTRLKMVQGCIFG